MHLFRRREHHRLFCHLCPPLFLTKRLFHFGSDPYCFTGAPLKWRHRLVWPQLTGEEPQHSNYLVNTEPPLNQQGKPAGSDATDTNALGRMEQPASMAGCLYLSHTAFVFCAYLEGFKTVLSASKPTFPTSKTAPSTQVDKQNNTFNGGCKKKPSADQTLANSTRCGLHTTFSFQLPILNT